MPNIWTHNIFGDAVANQASQAMSLMNKSSSDLFHLGCQGPDFMFYHHFLPWKGASALNKLGSRMHSEHCGHALITMAQFSKELRVPPDHPLAIYILGFMMHHVLDRHMHPYVFCKSGFKKWDHQRFEVIMDTLVVKVKLGLDTWATPAWKQIYIGNTLPKEVVTMMDHVTSTYYPDLHQQINIPEWNEAYMDMIRAQQIFHDPYRIKRLITFGKIEPLVYKRKNKPLDYLNESRNEWHHPARPEIASNASFWDMWELALTDGIQVWKAAEAYLFGNDDITHLEQLRQVIGNVSYEHGLPCEDGLDIRHEEPIW
jgi:hypothetical protein